MTSGRIPGLRHADGEVELLVLFEALAPQVGEGVAPVGERSRADRAPSGMVPENAVATALGAVAAIAACRVPRAADIAAGHTDIMAPWSLTRVGAANSMTARMATPRAAGALAAWSVETTVGSESGIPTGDRWRGAESWSPP